MMRWLCITLIALQAMLAGAVHAQPALPDQFIRFQAQDQQLQDIGWRLARGNAAYCDFTRLSAGLQLQDMRSYRSPDTVRRALGLAGDFAIASVAHRSPAEAAGLRPNQEVVAVSGQQLSAWPAQARFDWSRQTRVLDLIDRTLTQDGSIAIMLAGNETVKLRGQPICATRFELGDGGDHAVADGQRVVIGRDFPAFSYSQDELAAAIAHETAHVWLQHHKWLAIEGRKQRNIRATEREADRLMPWLLANAGYDPAAALRFMRRWGPKHDGGFLRKGTHDGWDERADDIAAELALVQQRMQASGRADWPQYFTRKTMIAGKLAKTGQSSAGE